MLSYQQLISTINEDSGSIWSKYGEIVEAKTRFFLGIFIVYPLIGPFMWVVLSKRILIAILILAIMYSVPMPFILKMVKMDKLRFDMLEKYWLPEDSCYVFLDYKLKWIIILTSSLVGVEIFIILFFIFLSGFLNAIILALLSIGMGLLFVLMNNMNCKNNVSLVHVLTFDSPKVIAGLIATELSLKEKKFAGNTAFRINMPQTGQSLTISKMEKNKDKVRLTLSGVNEKNLAHTKETVDKINAILEKIMLGTNK